MSYAAEILADSISPDGVRLTTLEVVFPRFILAEFNTHRMLSRNSNSSRAIPPERQIEKVRDNPFVPETFNRRVKGMGVGEAIEDQERARATWLHARDAATLAAENLLRLDCDKSRINRLLEPFLWHSAVVTGTEWDNFFALRDHPAAQPEFQIVARLMREAMDNSEPLNIRYGEWHLPLSRGFPMDDPNPDWDYWKLVSAGRLARLTSYDATSDEDPQKGIERSQGLIGSFHLSPAEHQARPFSPEEMNAAANCASQYRDDCRDLGTPFNQSYHDSFWFVGNLKGWVQFRKEIPNEHNAALAESLA